MDKARQWSARIVDEMDAKMNELGIDRSDPDRYFLLAMQLMMEIKPRLKPQPPRENRGRKPNPGQMARDVFLFEAVIFDDLAGKSVNAKIKHLTRTHPRFKGMNPATLRTRYMRLRDPDTPEGKRLHAFFEHVTREK